MPILSNDVVEPGEHLVLQLGRKTLSKIKLVAVVNLSCLSIVDTIIMPPLRGSSLKYRIPIDASPGVYLMIIIGEDGRPVTVEFRVVKKLAGRKALTLS